MEIKKPSFLESFLDGLNIHLYIPPFDVDFGLFKIADKGDWLTFKLDVGDWIEWSVDEVLYLTSSAFNEVISLIPTWDDILSLTNNVYKTLLDIANDLRDLITDNVATIYSQMTELTGVITNYVERRIEDVTRLIESSIATTYTTIIREVPGIAGAVVDGAIEPFWEPFELVTTYADDIVELFSDPLAWLYKRFNDMIEYFW